MSSRSSQDRVSAAGFIVAFLVGALGACLTGGAAIFLISAPRFAPSPIPIFSTPTTLIILPQESPPSLATSTQTPFLTQPTSAAEATPEAPTQTLQPEYIFTTLSVAQPPPCEHRSLIRGRVFDQGGKGLPGIQVHLFNDFGYQAFFSTWEKEPAGYYEFFMGPESGLFHLEILDATSHSISPVVDVQYEAGCVSEVDWQRIF